MKKITAKQATVIGSTLWIISILIYLLPNNKFYFAMLIFAEAIRALGLSLKGVADFWLIRNVLEERGLYDCTEQGQRQYALVEGNAMAVNCAGDAIMAVVSTILFNVHKDLPMWICLLSCVYGLILSCILPKTKQTITDGYVQNEKKYSDILKNRKIFTVLLHITVVYGTFCYWENLGKNLLQEIQVSSWSFGIIVAALYVANSVGGIVAGKRLIFKKFDDGKEFVLKITVANLVCFVILGVLGLINNSVVIIAIAVILFMQAMTKTSYINEMKIALQKQSDINTSKKISNLLLSGEHLGKTIILAIASAIIEQTSVAICYIMLAIILIIPCTIISKKLSSDSF